MTQQPSPQQHQAPPPPPPPPPPTAPVDAAARTGVPAVPPAQSFAAALGEAAAAPLGAPAAPDLGASFPSLVQPAAPAAALDVTAPLTAQSADAAPAGAPTVSLAMPQVSDPQPVQAMPDVEPEPARPELAATLSSERPDPIGGVAAADSADLKDLRARRATTRAPRTVVPGTGIWSPATALIIATAALTLQLLATYAREALPRVVAGNQPLDRFDVLVRDLPLVDSKVTSLGALLLGSAAVALVLLGWRRGIRDLPLQAAVGIIGVLSVLGAMLFPAIAG